MSAKRITVDAAVPWKRNTTWFEQRKNKTFVLPY